MIECKELSRGDIAHRAYDLYTQRGCEPGKDIETGSELRKSWRAKLSAKTKAA